MTVRQLSLSTATVSSQARTYDISQATDSDVLENMQHVTDLLSIGQVLCKQVPDGVDRLCQEVELITQGHAQLHLGHQSSSRMIQRSPDTSIALPIQFGQWVYGTLSVEFDPVHTERLAIPLPVAQLLAQICSWFLYTLEQSAFVQGQCQHLNYEIHGSLTKREREVLTLMYRGYDQETIAELLSITSATVGKHRQHIYEQLGVHCERDALLAAYHIGLFSLIEDFALNDRRANRSF